MKTFDDIKRVAKSGWMRKAIGKGVVARSWEGLCSTVDIRDVDFIQPNIDFLSFLFTPQFQWKHNLILSIRVFRSDL